MDLGTQVPHGAVRGYVMGERGAQRDDVKKPTRGRAGATGSGRRVVSYS